MSLAEFLDEPLRSSRPVQVLDRSIERGRLAHAILLHGKDLTEVEQVALALSRHLLGTRDDPSLHPDLFTLRPTGKLRQIKIGDAEDDDSNTMRSLLRSLRQTSNRGGHKVALIYEADCMNVATSNAFLKTLEEPPRECTLLLLTTRPYQLLETIRSRCFNFRIHSEQAAFESDAWSSWLNDYRQWLVRLEERPSRPDAVASVVLSVYGLTSRFNAILAAETATLWTGEKEKLPDEVREDSKALTAYEAGLENSIRERLLLDIEEQTRLHAIDASQRIPYPGLQLAQAIAELEHLSGLLRVNLKADTALEHFLLRSLRIWAS